MTTPVSAAAPAGTVNLGQWLYDQLMGRIEPELLTANLPKLTEVTENETEADRKIRAQRYEAAFAKYDEAFAEFSEKFTTQVKGYRKQALKQAEAQTRGEEETAMNSLLSSMQAA